MWNKAFFIFILFLAGCSSAEKGCSATEKAEVLSAMETAFQEWKETLNYMDYDLIDHEYHALQQCIIDAQPCWTIDSISAMRIDSINKAYTVSAPESSMIKRAEKLTRFLEQELFHTDE